MIYFTSDQHFGHEFIRTACKRPFENVYEMDEKLIDNWNAKVKPEDEVWHLGDFCWGNQQYYGPRYAARLNGTKHFIWGNHDKPAVKTGKYWASSQIYKEIKTEVDGKQVCFILFHYGMKVWNGSFGNRRIYQLYGHSHGTLPGNSRQVDVGVDYPAWNYSPVNAEEILDHLKTLPERQING